MSSFPRLRVSCYLQEFGPRYWQIVALCGSVWWRHTAVYVAPYAMFFWRFRCKYAIIFQINDTGNTWSLIDAVLVTCMFSNFLCESQHPVIVHELASGLSLCGATAMCIFVGSYESFLCVSCAVHCSFSRPAAPLQPTHCVHPFQHMSAPPPPPPPRMWRVMVFGPCWQYGR